MSAKPQILTVLGEQVSLEPISFDPSEKFLVSFDEKYKFPGMTDGEVTALKAILLKLFSGSGVLSTLFTAKAKQPPLPPCSNEEKDLLLKSLTHRFMSLRNELIAERQSKSDSLRLRQITDQLQRLKEYIDFAKQSTACEELDEDVLAETVGDLSDDQILQLLRQFVFFVLQGQHPLEDFRGRDPNPKGFVARLSKKPMTDFDSFLDEYRQKKHPVPLPIEKVLQVTKAGVDAMESELQNSLEEKTSEIVSSLSSTFPANNPFWTNLDTSNLDAIIDRLLEYIGTLQQEIEECETTARRDQTFLVDLDTERERLENEIATLQAKLQIAEAVQENFERDSLENGSTAEVEELRDQMQQSIDALKQQIANLQTKENALLQKVQEAEQLAAQHMQQIAEKEQALQRCKEIEAENQTLRRTLASYEGQLADARKKIKECEEVETRAKTLEKTLATRESELAELRKAAGPLTQEIDTQLREKAALESEKKSIEEDVQEFSSMISKLETFFASLGQGRIVLLDLLGSIQQQRASLVPETDDILQRIISLRSSIEQSESHSPNISQEVAQLLKDVQAELAERQAQLQSITQQMQEKDSQIEAAKQAMEESNTLLQQIRAGRVDLSSKGIQFETDKEFLEGAIRAVEAEKELKTVKEDLEATVAKMQGLTDSLQADIVALQTHLEKELQTVKQSLQSRTEELASEQQKSASLQGNLAERESQLASLQNALAQKEEEANQAQQDLEQERSESAAKIAALQKSTLQECEERLKALRAEEEEKRKALLGAQGAEKGTLEAKINELLTQITGVEGERDAAEAELDVEKGKLQAIEANLETITNEHLERMNELQQRIKSLEEEKGNAVGESARLKEQVSSLGGEIEDLRRQVMDDAAEKEKLFAIISKISTWIASGAKEEQPQIDESLNQKYGLNRILESFLAVLPKEKESEDASDCFSSAMSRCYLVFFMTYVYARHFPKKQDGDSSYQSEITAFLRGILTEVYKQLEIGIPGKLEPVGSAGIPVQLKSKYLMNIFMTLIKQMELVHASGKKGADFLKYDLLDQDQLKTLHTLHRIVSDKLKLSNKDIMKTLNMYVIRKTGNVDDDIANLFLRFVHDTKTEKEYPVILYQLPDAKEVPKFTFGTETDFTQYLASPTVKSADQQKVGSPLDKQLVTKPVFSFNLLFYLFLFTVKDYLSSIEGELDKAGCPLPPILKHP